MQNIQLFLDADGVLAAFDTMFEEITGHHPRAYEKEHGASALWRVVESHPGGFFRSLPKMHDAEELVESVRHLNPIILTGVPLGNSQYNEQKLAWRDEHFPGIPMICCQSKKKWTQMHPVKHNVIVDDWHKYKSLWEEKGGTFILHTSAKTSIQELRDIGVL